MEVLDILKKNGAELYPEDLAFFEAELDTGDYSIEYIDACKKLIGEIRAWKKQATAQNGSDSGIPGNVFVDKDKLTPGAAKPMTEKELRKLMEKNRLAASPYVLINRMYSRNVLNKVTDADEPTWKISDFYSRYSYYAQFEYYEFGCLPRELIEALYDWQTEIYQSIYLPQVKAKVAGEGVYVHNQTYLTLEEFDKIIDGHHGSIHLVPCNCKSQKYFHDRKLNVCVNMNDGPNSAVDRGMGEPISPEDMKKKVREFNASGLMQNGEDGFICNCDGLCCFPMQMAYKAGSRLIYPESNWKIDWHEDECVNCGKCTKICNFGAFYKDENRKVHYDVDKCWGCTICAPNCPKHAIHLLPREQKA